MQLFIIIYYYYYMKATCACAVWGDQIHRLALYMRLSLLLRTLFSCWLVCRNARSTVKLTKMIDFEVSDSNMACGRGLCYRPGGQKAASRGLCGCFLFIHNSQPLLKLSRGRETWLTRQNSVTTIAHAHGTLLTDIARTLQTAVCHSPVSAIKGGIWARDYVFTDRIRAGQSLEAPPPVVYPPKAASNYDGGYYCNKCP
jgi:hypothetical protein